MAQLLKRLGRDNIRMMIGAETIPTRNPVAIRRDATRSIGLYVISLSGAERSFSYLARIVSRATPRG